MHALLCRRLLARLFARFIQQLFRQLHFILNKRLLFANALFPLGTLGLGLPHGLVVFPNLRHPVPVLFVLHHKQIRFQRL